MSVIKIRGRSDPIFRPYEVAKKIKQRKFGDDNVSPPIPKASPSDLIDLGDEWSGSYGQITSIELNDKPQPPRIASEDDRPLTPEEKVRADKAREETREWLIEKGIINKKPNDNEKTS